MLSVNLTGYSQTTVLSKTGDTTICFTVPQSKFLLKKVYEVEKFKILDSICNEQLSLCDSIQSHFKIQVMKQDEIISNTNKIIELKEYQIAKLEEVLKEQKKEIKKQRRRKNLAITGGIISTGFFAYLWLFQ